MVNKSVLTWDHVIYLQNLLALLFRPLRLIVNGKRLRKVRIIMLKATHAPFVGIIWAYEESSSRLFSSPRPHPGPAATSSMQADYQTLAPRPHSSHLGNRSAAKLSTAPHSHVHELPHGSFQSQPSNTALNTADSMADMLQKLSAQVDRLTQVAALSKEG